MAENSHTFRGIVRGRTIEFTEDVGLPEGQEVAVTVQPIVGNASEGSAEVLRHCFGAWSEEARELEEFLAWNRTQRKLGREEPYNGLPR